MADFQNPKNTNPLLSLFGYVRDGLDSIARMFDGTTDSNVPTGAKKIDGSTKEVFQWNGSSWDSLGFINDTADAGAVASAALAAGGGVELWVANAATGNGSGSDASNYMSWITFATEYGGSSASYNTFNKESKLIINLPSAASIAASGVYKYFNDYDIVFVISSGATFTTNAMNFTNCRIRVSGSGTFTLYDSILHSCNLSSDGALASSNSLTMNDTRCAIGGALSSGSYLALDNVSLKATSLTTTTYMDFSDTTLRSIGNIVCGASFSISNTELFCLGFESTGTVNLQFQSDIICSANAIMLSTLVMEDFSNLKCEDLDITTSGVATSGSTIVFVTVSGVTPTSGDASAFVYNI